MIDLTTPELDELIALMDYSLEEGWDEFALNVKTNDPDWDVDAAKTHLNAVRQEVFYAWTGKQRNPLLKL